MLARRARTGLLLLGLLALAPPLAAAAPLAPAAVASFIDDMAARHGFERAALATLFAGIERNDRIISLMTRPAEKVKPWWEYRALFISEKRIKDGIAFWHENAASLARAQDKYGVPPEVIVAIIGVETSYGRITGGHRVMEALATLAFHYPGGNEARAKFFRAQLEHALLLAREEALDPLELEGSYAGALGMPQFMPENYRKLAVDFDGDGRRNIWTDADDAIGSVANYLHHHGWRAQGQIVSQAQVGGGDTGRFVQTTLKPDHQLGQLIASGIAPVVPNSHHDDEVALFELEARNGNEYWIGYTNFYVISRYNPRIKYAMAVAQLAEAIRSRRGAATE
ncbi:MAG: lytic murein transglycosylase B [Gammaproteobacteria bacterium]